MVSGRVILSLLLAGLVGLPEPIFQVEDGRIAEASGLAISADGMRYFAVPDAGGAAEVYVINGKGETNALLTFPVQITNQDWEDIASVRTADGKEYLYIADTGDAFFVRRAASQPPRTSFALIKVDMPAPNAKGAVLAANPVVYPFQYADKSNRNVEALFVHQPSGRVYVVDKTEKPDQPAVVWSAPAKLSTGGNVLRKVVADVRIQGVSGAAASPTGDRVVLRNATKAYLWWIKNGNVAASMGAAPIVIDLPAQKQGEGVAFTPDGHSLVVNSEGVKQAVWRVPLPENADAPDPKRTRVLIPVERTGQDKIMFAVAGGAGAFAALLLLFALVRHRRQARL